MIHVPITKYRNIHDVGEKMRKGKLLFKKGRALRPYGLYVLPTSGYRFVKVSRRPKVGMLSTGSELKDLESTMM